MGREIKFQQARAFKFDVLVKFYAVAAAKARNFNTARGRLNLNVTKFGQ
ncbi:hypothetical protein [uncultured Campylobacter sp.]|nr:hypothetical protein [uncultured Campylobacter sp.]